MPPTSLPPCLLHASPPSHLAAHALRLAGRAPTAWLDLDLDIYEQRSRSISRRAPTEHPPTPTHTHTRLGWVMRNFCCLPMERCDGINCEIMSDRRTHTTHTRTHAPMHPRTPPHTHTTRTPHTPPRPLRPSLPLCGGLRSNYPTPLLWLVAHSWGGHTTLAFRG